MDDGNYGTAKVGEVQGDVGDSEQGIVIARFDDEERDEAFDRRELINLGPAKLSTGPVLLYPRHLWAIVRQPVVLFSMLVTVAVAAGIALKVQEASADGVALALICVPWLLVLLVGMRRLDRYLAREIARKNLGR